MSDRTRIGLDNPAFSGRLRQPTSRVQSARSRPPVNRPVSGGLPARPAKPQSPQLTRRPLAPRNPVTTVSRPIQQMQQTVPQTLTDAPVEKMNGLSDRYKIPVQVVKPAPFVRPSQPKQQRSAVLQRQIVQQPQPQPIQPTYNENSQGGRRFQGIFLNPRSAMAKLKGYSKAQLALTSMAVFIFTFGVFASVKTIETNKKAAAQVAAISQTVDQGSTTDEDAAAGTGSGGNSSSRRASTGSPPPSTTKVSSSAYSRYVVSADLPRYIKIPKLGVNARVLQVGVKANGELATPTNVFDTGWYSGSSRPGQAGATLIDGHVSSWSTKGVFYGLKLLNPGDIVKVERGDGLEISYRVVQKRLYNADNVDMKAAVSPINPAKPGLNLITCAGQVKRGTSDFTQRIVVFAEQM